MHIPLRVLIVDDEPLISWAVGETLAECGDFVTKTGNGENAVRALVNTPGAVDVVLLDYQLPDSHDLGLLSNLRRLAPDSSVILMTAYGSPELAARAMELGAYRVLDKPFDMDEVARVVHQAGVAHQH